MKRIDQMISRLVPLLRDADPVSFDNAVEQAKSQLTAETNQSKQTDLGRLFDIQIATLKDRDVPEQIVRLVQNQKDAVIQKASGMIIGEENIPFLPIIPRSYLSPHSQMAATRNGVKVGYTDIDPNSITDQVKTSHKPYYIYDVEDGTSTLGNSPEDAEKIINRQRRFSFTVAEILALVVHTNVLSRYCVWATASRYDGSIMNPYASLNDTGRPGLKWGFTVGSDGRWASPSAGSR